MAATTNLMSWEAFEELPDDCQHYELIEGELQVLPPPKSGHSNVAMRTLKSLLPFEDKAGGRFYAEAGYKLSHDPATWIEPDVSFLRIERVRRTPGSEFFLGAPDLAVEVVSPSESAADLDRKVQLMLRSGTSAVIVVYPKPREVEMHLPGGSSRRLTAADTLRLPDLVPGWELPVASLFED